MRATIAILATFLAATCTYAQQFERQDAGPFTPEEAEQLSEVWPQIRDADSFQDIDWEDAGIDFPPGDAEARRLMAMHWEELRQAERFRDIDWEETTGYRESELGGFQERDRGIDRRDRGVERRDRGFEPRDRGLETGPFTRREAEELSEVWPEIREAASFEDIDWQSVGLQVAPGDAEARILMAEHWDELRRAERFEEIDWESLDGYRVR